MKLFLPHCLAGVALMVSANALHGAVLYSTNFNSPTFSDGDLVGISPQDGWANHSGTGSFVQVVNTATNGAIALAQGGGSREDVSRSFAAIATGQTYFASFDVTVSGGSTAVYFAHFKDAASDFGARVFVTPGVSGDYTIGLSDASASADVSWATDLSFGTAYTIVTAYARDTGLTRLWINPTSESSTAISTVGLADANFSAYAFRQASGNSTQLIDNLTVGTSFSDVVVIPEPSRALLLGFAAFGIFLRRRR